MPLSPLLALVLVAACATPVASPVALPAAPATFAHAGTGASATAAPSAAAPAAPWTALADPALPDLLAHAEQSAPTVAQALARVAQARARLGTAQAGSQPQLNAFAQVGRSNSSSAGSGSSAGGGSAGGAGAGGSGASSAGTPAYNAATAGLNLSWEIDLFGRLAYGRQAAQSRLDAADADAQMTRLTLRAQVADTLVVYRACLLAAARQQDSLDASTTTLRLTEIRQGAGLAPLIDVSRARTSTGEVRNALLNTQGQCEQALQSLAYLTGDAVDPLRSQLQVTAAAPASQLLVLPTLAPALPASVIAGHPQVLRAQRTADAAWQDLGALRAARYPSLNLGAALSATLIRVGTFQQSFNSWSLGPNLAMALFDGGRIAANAADGQARYEEAVAGLAGAVRDTVRDVELALIQGQTAAAAAAQAQDTLQAGTQLYAASEAAQRAGRLSLFELESARLSLLGAQTSLINAHRDQARAWIALQKAAGVP